MRPDPRTAPTLAATAVLKFGGAGLANGERVRRACRVVRERGGARPVVVVSAVGEVTDLLGQALAEAERGEADSQRVRLRHKRLLAELGLEPGLLNRHVAELETLLAAVARRGRTSPAQRDHALASGERMSARVLAAALRASGLEATPVDAWDLGLRTDSRHGRARPLHAALAEVGRALARVPGVPVVTGFVAADADGRLTTLGRSGSDLTATLLAEASGAREVQLWKTVGGVMSADPALVAEARVLGELSYRQAAALAFHGAGVLHPDALLPLERAGIPARVLDLDHPEAAGTHIAPAPGVGAPALACRRGLALLRLERDAARGRAELVAQLFETLAKLALEPVALATQPEGIALVTSQGRELDLLLAELSAARGIERDLASVAWVAPTPQGLDVPAATAALAAAHVAPLFATLDPPRATALWVVREERLAQAARALHARVARPQLTPAGTGSAP